MRAFADLQQEFGLKRFLSHPLGTLYFVPTGVNPRRMIVRHFDGEVSPEMIPVYVDLIRSAQTWIEQHTALSRYVRVEQPLEIGTDFVARPHPVYYTSTASYEDEKIPPPESLDKMRQAFLQALEHVTTPRNVLITTILRRSIIEPNGKTYPVGQVGDKDAGFIVVEPRLTLEDLKQWAAL